MQKSMVVLSVVFCGMAVGQSRDLPARPPGEFFGLRAADHEGAASFEKGQPLVGTTYFYWYDIESGSHITDGDGSDALTTHPADMEGISYRSAAWHQAQLADMIEAGVDFLMPVYWGVPGDYDGWSFVGLPALVEAHTALQAQGVEPPAIGLFYDTSILRYNSFNPGGRSYHVDLTTDFGKEWFYTAIRDFFSLIPRSRRRSGPASTESPSSFFTRPTSPKSRTRSGSSSTPGAGSRRTSASSLSSSADWEGQADATYSWGGAVNGPLIFKETIALGPGYDHSAVPGRQPLIVERRDGQTYIDRWTKVLQLDPERRPWMVHVETWNEWHEGTDVAHSTSTAGPRSCSSTPSGGPGWCTSRRGTNGTRAPMSLIRPVGIRQRRPCCMAAGEAVRIEPAAQRRRRGLGIANHRGRNGGGLGTESPFATLAVSLLQRG